MKLAKLLSFILVFVMLFSRAHKLNEPLNFAPRVLLHTLRIPLTRQIHFLPFESALKQLNSAEKRSFTISASSGFEVFTLTEADSIVMYKYL